VEREAAAALRRGDVAASVEMRDGADLLTRGTTPAELHARLVSDWHEQWTATRDPMIAASNDTRARLNAAARALLSAAGVLQGPLWRTSAGIEFRAGDWVVARHNDRRLRAETGGFWVRNGACGEIIAVDPRSGGLVVDFAGHAGEAHRVHLPGRYVEDHLEHGYALTDYGVQGRTLSRALAVLEEASTTPGLYVATTRGRHENRLYVATGDTIDGDTLDTSHGIPRISAPSLQDLTAHVAARRSDDMLHDSDPLVHTAAALAEATSEGELRAELQGLDRALDEIPNDQQAALESALRARRQLTSGAGSHGDGPAAGDLGRRLARLDASIDRLGRLQHQRDQAVRDRDERRARRAVVSDAIAIRRLKDRLAAPAPNTQPSVPSRTADSFETAR
jgi:hypothetical protein